MSFLRSITNIVSDVVRSAMPGTSPYEVQEINHSQTSNYETLSTSGALTLYREKTTYLCILHHSSINHSKAYSLYRSSNDVEADSLFRTFTSRLQLLCDLVPRIVVNREMLQKLCDSIRTHRGWCSTHLAAYHGIASLFQNPAIASHIEDVCEETQVRPLHVAILAEQTACIKELLVAKAQVCMADNKGDNCFHYAARLKDSNIVQMLGSRDASAINQLNKSGESALHAACLSGRAENVEQLLRWGAEINNTMSTRFPIHCAMKSGNVSCIKTMCKWQRGNDLKILIQIPDHKYGGAPLHWAQNKECIDLLVDMKVDLDLTNDEGETALDVMVKLRRPGCVMALLTHGADAAIVSKSGNTAIHHAIKADNIDIVKALIVFGADVNVQNMQGETPRHIAATSMEPNHGSILYLLHRVGARRCIMGFSLTCQAGCSAEGGNDGIPPENCIQPEQSVKQVYDTIVSDIAINAALTRSASATGSSVMDDSALVDCTDTACAARESRTGDTLLCLDGGGIRGLVLIQILLAIEKAAGRPIRDCFDWVAGTSTGGILALAIVHKKSIRYAQGMYFRLKDAVFCGSRPYDSMPLEALMKKEFGESTRMSEVSHPKVLVTAVLGDRHPSELHFFRNFDNPVQDYDEMKQRSKYPMVDRPNEQFVWKAARSSGAAPTFFRTMGRYIDGGLMANNPTLDALTEIHEYNVGMKSKNKPDEARRLHLVVSLGTGRIPITPVSTCDVFRPGGLIELYNVVQGASSLGKLLVDQATQAEGRPVERARAWCSMIDVPYFRFSPQLSEDVGLDCTDDNTIVNMLWETQCYITEQRAEIEQLATLLA